MNEKFYLFKRAADGVWIFGANEDCEHPSGVCRVIPSTDRTKVSIIYIHKNEANQSKYDVPIENFLDSTGTPYVNFAALKAGYAGFFFSVSGVSTDGFLYIPSAGGLRVRIGYRAGFTYAIDRELTLTGFQGIEGVDWENIGGNAE